MNKQCSNTSVSAARQSLVGGEDWNPSKAKTNEHSYGLNHECGNPGLIHSEICQPSQTNSTTQQNG